MEAAAAARMATVSRYPGAQSIAPNAALALVTRGTQPVMSSPTTSANTAASMSPALAEAGAGVSVAAAPAVAGYRFTHDPRLTEPSLAYLSEAAMCAYLRRITCPTLWVTGTTGWPWPEWMLASRPGCFADLEHHHLHAGELSTASVSILMVLSLCGRPPPTPGRRLSTYGGGRRTILCGAAAGHRCGRGL